MLIRDFSKSKSKSGSQSKIDVPEDWPITDDTKPELENDQIDPDCDSDFDFDSVVGG